MPTRKLIYVPSEELWESVKKAAKEDGRSASNYLIQLHRVNIGRRAEPLCAAWESLEPSSTKKDK